MMTDDADQNKVNEHVEALWLDIYGEKIRFFHLNTYMWPFSAKLESIAKPTRSRGTARIGKGTNKVSRGNLETPIIESPGVP